MCVCAALGVILPKQHGSDPSLLTAIVNTASWLAVIELPTDSVGASGVLAILIFGGWQSMLPGLVSVPALVVVTVAAWLLMRKPPFGRFGLVEHCAAVVGA